MINLGGSHLRSDEVLLRGRRTSDGSLQIKKKGSKKWESSEGEKDFYDSFIEESALLRGFRK